MSLIATLATFVASAVAPDAALGIARDAFLDTIGVTLAGAVEPAARAVQQVVAAEKSAPECRVLGTALSASASLAALANGTAAHALDYDAMNRETSYTPPGSAPFVFTYDVDGRRTSSALPGGRSQTRSYDVAARLTGIDDGVADFRFL